MALLWDSESQDLAMERLPSDRDYEGILARLVNDASMNCALNLAMPFHLNPRLPRFELSYIISTMCVSCVGMS